MNIKHQIVQSYHKHEAIQDRAGIVISPRLHRADAIIVQHKLLLPGTDYDETFWDSGRNLLQNRIELTATLRTCISCLQSIARNTTQAEAEGTVFTYETLASLMNVNARGLHEMLNKLTVSGFCGVQQVGYRTAFRLTGVLSLPGAKESGILRNVIGRPQTKRELEQGNHKGYAGAVGTLPTANPVGAGKALVLMRCVLDKRIWQQRFTKAVGSLADTTGPKAITVEEHQKHEKHSRY